MTELLHNGAAAFVAGAALAIILDHLFLGPLLERGRAHLVRSIQNRTRQIVHKWRPEKAPLVGDSYAVGAGRTRVFVVHAAAEGYLEGNIACGWANDFDRTWPDVPDASHLGQLMSRFESDVHATPPELFPLPPDHVTDEVARTTSRLEAEGRWNGSELALRAMTDFRGVGQEHEKLRLTFGHSLYGIHRTVAAAWYDRENGADAQGSRLTQEQLNTVFPGLSHSFGVNATVVLHDDRLVLTRRSPVGSSTFAGCRHISVNEGMSDKDKDASGNPDPRAALIRGLWEELGLTEGTGGDFAAPAIKFHALALTLSHYEWALLGHIDLSQTPITMKVLQERRRGGVKDRTELDLEFDPPVYLHDLNSIANVLNGPWVPHGAINLMFSAMLVHGQSARRKLEPYLEHLT